MKPNNLLYLTLILFFCVIVVPKYHFVYGNTTSKYEYYPDYDFREDACYYKIIPNTNNVELMMYGRFNNRDGGIYAPDSCYIIPETVKYNGQTYYITIIGKLSFSFLWKNLTKITIPPSVTEIKEYAFMECTKLQEIVIPDNVSSIGRGAFIGCAQLCKITIPDKINKIEDYTFQNCKSLTDFSIGNNIKIIGDKAFAQSGLTSIVIPDGTDSIKESAFENCQHLKSAVISQSVRYIGKNAFYSGINVEGSELTFIKGNLSAINVEEDNGVYSSENGVLFNKDKTVLIKYPPKNELSMQYKIPLSVKKIEEYAFVAAILDSVFIPKSVNDIGKYAFSHSNICSITIPDSIKDIKSSTFSGCKNLSVVVLPKGIKEIQDGAFANCINLKYINFPESLEYIESRTFGGNTNSFINTAWYNEYPDGAVYVGNLLWTYKGTMPYENTLKIKQGTLKILPGVIGYLPYNAKQNLRAISIPASIISIGEDAFTFCDNLKEIYLDWTDFTNLDINNNAFTTRHKNRMWLSVPKGTKEKYKTAKVWGNFKIKERRK